MRIPRAQEQVIAAGRELAVAEQVIPDSDVVIARMLKIDAIER